MIKQLFFGTNCNSDGDDGSDYEHTDCRITTLFIVFMIIIGKISVLIMVVMMVIIMLLEI